MTPIVDTSDRHSPKFKAVSRRAFERRVLHLVQGYGPVQDARFRDAHDGSSAATIFLRAELEGEYPQTGVMVYTMDRATDVELESRHSIWDSEFADGDVADAGDMLPPERIADEILARARDSELGDFTVTSASGTEWRESYAAVERRAFELHVLDLIRGYAPLQDARERDSIAHPIVFLRAELVGEYPQTYIRINLYQRSFEREISSQYRIWEPDYANGDVVDVEHMRHPGWITAEIMMYARGG